MNKNSSLLRWVPIALALCASFLCYADAPPTHEIRVQLATSTPLEPLYVGKFQVERCTLDRSYLDQLEGILAFDFKYNGATNVLNTSDQKEKLLQQKDTVACFHSPSWKSMGVAHVIKTQVSDNKLHLMVFSTGSGSLKTFKDIPLVGVLSEDRKQIHKVADSIHKALFNTDGIASTRVLYSVQQKSPKPDGQNGINWLAEIWESDWDGANARQVTKENNYCVSPVFIPAKSGFSSNRFLYVSYKLGQPKIFIASIKEGMGKRVIDLRGNQMLPAISPQRDKIAYICDASGRTDLFLQTINPESGQVGKPAQLFSYPRSTQASPTFSPDGSKVAFVSDKDGSPRIYVIPTSAGGKRSNATLITKQNSESSCPAWSPDGTKLAYSAKTKGVRQIWIYDFATREEWQLTDGPSNKENPAWAPNSKHIVFNSVDANSSELFIVNLNQPEAVRITKGPGKKHYPTWGAR